MNTSASATFSCNTITCAELQSWLKGSKPPVLIDVRTGPEYQEVHIPGAHSLPLDTLSAASVAAFSGSDIVLICQSGMRAERAAKKLSEAGCSNLLVLKDGTLGWIAAGLPVERGQSTVLPLMRQVQLTIGLISLSGAVLALTVNPWFALIPAFTGAGLTFAGATGFCGLALLLAKMPWNRTPVSCNNGTCCSGR